MDIAPRQVGGLAALALVPFGVYWAASGRLTPVTATIGVLNILLILTTVVLAFSPETELDRQNEPA